MAEFNLKIKCTNCKGTGEVTVGGGSPPGSCPICGGDGHTSVGVIDGLEEIDDLTNKVDDCLSKLDDILEKLNE